MIKFINCSTQEETICNFISNITNCKRVALFEKEVIFSDTLGVKDTVYFDTKEEAKNYFNFIEYTFLANTTQSGEKELADV